MQTLTGPVVPDDDAVPPEGEDDELELPPLEPGDDDDGGGRRRPPREPWSDRTRSWVEKSIDVFVVLACVGFVLAQLGPSYLIYDTTTAGGDMGAHVWGPAFLRDHLLPSLRLSGWTPDWYDGFPAFQFYMVVPALAVVLLNTGIHGWAALIPALAAVGLVGAAFVPGRSPSRRRLLLVIAALVAVFLVGLPYGVAFKLVTVLGIASIPASAYVFGRLAGLPFPTPAVLSVGSLVFLFNREPTSNGTGNIIGGNVTSTLAGEYSFSIALSLALVFLGLVVNGLHTGRRRWLAAILFALTVTCHLIVGLFAAGAALVALVVWPGLKRLSWLVVAGLTGALLSGFWTLPFLARSAYVNDMGWEKSPADITKFSWWEIITNHPPSKALAATLNTVRGQIANDYLAPSGLQWVIALAFVGVVVSIVLRIRAGWWLGILTALLAFGFLVCPEARLWNARLLPFYYLCLVLLAAIGVAEVVRAIALLVAPDPERPVFGVSLAAPLLALAVVLVVVGVPLGVIPHQDANGLTLGPIDYQVVHNPARDWARWNYSGYEDKAAYPEFHDLVATMAKVGTDRGCGRAMWEYDGKRLEGYGTPMAPMLLPLFTDGCIGSMEGLYFESSATTPFHFLNQSELSTACSCAQRNLPYGGFDINKGVEHLQLMGVRYYLAATPAAVQAAARHPALTEVAVSGPWHVYQVAGSELVQGLTNEPAVVTDHADGLDWVYGDSSPHSPPLDANGAPIKADGPGVTWYLDKTRHDVFLASSGPASWQRVASGATPSRRVEPDVQVTNVHTSTDGVSFDVDRTGVPVLVKISYFPNWQASGADGPWRVAPNLMVVVPTATHVSLHFGRTAIDWLAWLATFAGLALVVWLARRPVPVMPDRDHSNEDVLVDFLEAPEAQDEGRRAWWADHGEVPGEPGPDLPPLTDLPPPTDLPPLTDTAPGSDASPPPTDAPEP